MKFGSGTSAQEWAAYGPVPERVAALVHGVHNTLCVLGMILFFHTVFHGVSMGFWKYLQ